jgi:hypothetical protein
VKSSILFYVVLAALITLGVSLLPISPVLRQAILYSLDAAVFLAALILFVKINLTFRHNNRKPPVAARGFLLVSLIGVVVLLIPTFAASQPWYFPVENTLISAFVTAFFATAYVGDLRSNHK